MEEWSVMAKKMKVADDFIHHLYIHMNDVDHFVVFSGLRCKQFFLCVEPMKNVLLLKSSFEDGSYNMHTHHDFVSMEDMPLFIKKLTENQSELCWLDFDSEKNVNQLSTKEQAELLYFAHKREPLESPFFDKLQNRYAFYANPADKTVKIYFRFLAEVEQMTANLFNNMMKDRTDSVSFWRRRSRNITPVLDPMVLRSIRHYVKEGALLSLYKMEKSGQYGIEIRTLANYNYPDEVWDDLHDILKQNYDELIQTN